MGNRLNRATGAIPIRPIGGFFENDADGFVLNPCSFERVRAHWMPVLEAVRQYYLDRFGTLVHSIYLRGSLPRGLAVEGFSDLDTFCLLKAPGFRWEEVPGRADLESRLRREFPFVWGVELQVSSFNETLETTYPALAAILKTQSLCLFGTDISSQMPAVRPGPDLMIYRHWLEQDVRDFLSKKTIKHIDCQDIMKTLIRSAFELVMARAGRFTPDLYWCWRAFSDFYPDRKPDLRQALHWYLNPTADVSFLHPFVHKTGFWLRDSFLGKKEC